LPQIFLFSKRGNYQTSYFHNRKGNWKPHFEFCRFLGALKNYSIYFLDEFVQWIKWRFQRVYIEHCTLVFRLFCHGSLDHPNCTTIN
jgi:hypothetical protein